LIQAGEDIQATLNVLLLADLFVNLQAGQQRVVGSLFRNRYRRFALQEGSQVWQLPAVRRGVEIEIRRAGRYRLPPGFPVVDMLRQGTAVSIKSIDVSLKSYRQGSRLLYRLKGYVNKLIDFRGATWGGRTVRGNVNKELEIIVPRGKATDSQQKVFDEVVEYGRLNGISVKFTEL